MAVRSARIEEIYRLVRSAVITRSPISARYHGRQRLLCPHRLGWNRRRQPRVLCYQYGGESESGLEPVGSSANWRCIAVEDLRRVELLEGAWRTAPNHARPQTCVAEVDVDAEDQPARDPQKGQCGSSASR
jgi:hypothetical protein